MTMIHPSCYLTELDLDAAETKKLLEDAMWLKKERIAHRDLAGKHVALYFEKPSVRTRVSFSVAVHELGGNVVELGPSNTKVGKGEDPEDFAKVIGRYVSVLVARVFAQEKLLGMAEHAGIPVINALSDERHPCQALADVLTIIERKGTIEGLRIAFIGEGNNVAVSIALLATALGAKVIVASPSRYGLPALAKDIEQTEDVTAAVANADVLYTDTWISMGQEGEAEERRQAFFGYKIDRALLQRAKTDAIVLHCLPAVRGEEIDVDVMYSDQSAIWDQAENRLHVQKALLRRIAAYTDR
jgi:ornithine carbamoyltransferase